MLKLLNSKPQSREYLERMGAPIEQLELLGVDIDGITTLRDMTDIMVLIKALKGDIKAKAWMDEKYNQENQQKSMNTQSQ